jgi:hypothetical protein
MNMKVDAEKLFTLMKERCNGNYNKFARELQIDPSHLYRYMNNGIGGGRKFIGAVIRYCRANGIDFGEYIILD